MKLITAGPGSGKTQRLASDIQDRLDEGVSPYMIMATTFTREAAREIAERLGGEVSIRTVHGLGYWLIRLARRVRGEVVPRVISEEKAMAVMERAAKELDVKFIEPRRAMDDMARIRERGGRLETLHPQVQHVIERYFEILSSENLMDFTGILDEARKELADPDLQAFLQGQHLFVDEGQDISPVTEWPILEVLMKGSCEFVMFASPSQQIYGFRGACWEKLCSLFPEDLTIETMNQNHRSTPEIIRAASPLAGPDADTMVPVKESLGIPVLAVDVMNPEMEADFVGRQIAEWLDQGIEAKEIAVLARVHSMLNIIQMALRMRNIPFQIVGGRKSLFHREEAQAVLGYLRLALDPMDDTVLESVIDYPPCGIGTRTRNELRRDGYLTWDHLFGALAHPNKFRKQVISRIHRILDLREYFEEVVRSGLPLMQAIARIIELSEIPTYLNSEGDFQATIALNDLLKLSVEFPSLNRFIEYLDAEVRRPREVEGVQLSTLHASKGREFCGVIIPGFQDGVIPLDGSELQEEQNLAFVGMTRAKYRLVLTLNRSLPPSRFLSKLPVQVALWPPH